MGVNVAQVLESDAKSMFQKLSENGDVANAMMGFIGRITMICAQTSKPIQGVELGTFHENNGDFKAPLSFHTLLLSPPALWTLNRYDDMKHYVAAKSVHLARVLELNAKLTVGLRGMVETIEKFCDRKRMKFADFKVKRAFITPDNRMCVIKAGVDTLDRWGR